MTSLFAIFLDKRDDFDFEIVNFPIFDSDVPHSTSYGVYISNIISLLGLLEHLVMLLILTLALTVSLETS